MASPRSSLIISDEALSSETAKGTDFVVLLSVESQGGIKTRRRAPGTEFPYAGPRDRLPYWRVPVVGADCSWSACSSRSTSDLVGVDAAFSPPPRRHRGVPGHS